jgi:TetR/AcrR family transcriptional repressor of nem operon
MKVSREQAAENREKILATASKLFREKGFDGIGVADLMKSAGLTHGGFYGHFSSKEDLMAQACIRAADEILQGASERRAGKTNDPFRAYVEFYLSIDHRDNSGSGCLMAALGADAARQSSPVRQAFTASFKRLLQALVSIVPAKPNTTARDHALVTLATLVGAQIIARAVEDPKLSREILQTVLKQVS